MCDVYRDRIETLLPICLGLKDAILYRRNVEAFKMAWELNEVIRRFQDGQRVG